MGFFVASDLSVGQCQNGGKTVAFHKLQDVEYFFVALEWRNQVGAG